jgi:hypothetical protein
MAGLRLLDRIDGKRADGVDAFLVERSLAWMAGEPRIGIGGFV